MRQVPRILAIIPSRVFYGQERANVLVLDVLKEQGCEILTVVEDHASFPIVPQELEKRRIPYVKAPTIGRRVDGYLLDFVFGNPIRLLRLRKKFRGILNNWAPTHIHVPSPFAFLMADVIASPDIPIIYRIGDKPNPNNIFWRWIWRRIARRVTHFVADSEFIADQLANLGIDRANITVIFTPPARRCADPKPYLRPQIPQNILFIGQINPNKGIDRLIEAFQLVLREYPAARLTIVGKISEYSGGDWQRALRDSTLADATLGKSVSFAGEQNDIYSYLAASDFLVVPSVCEEAFGLVVGEAKAAARPSVVFPRGGLPEQVNHCEDGFICRDVKR